jgi:hypothetical protein
MTYGYEAVGGVESEIDPNLRATRHEAPLHNAAGTEPPRERGRLL